MIRAITLSERTNHEERMRIIQDIKRSKYYDTLDEEDKKRFLQESLKSPRYSVPRV